jgi:hypothetical protein
MRKASLDRTTKETSIRLRLTIEGRGRYKISTGIRFFDHMLELFAHHGGFDLELAATGDLDITEFAPKSVKPRGSLDVLMDTFQPEGQDTWLWANKAELRNMCASQNPPGPTPRRVRMA